MTRIFGLLPAVALLASCTGDPTATARAPLRPAAALETQTMEASVDQELATLRRVTATFHDISAASAAGWSAPITGCMADASGGMGFHFGNVALIDGSAEVDKPELLMYEPQRNGRMKLVGVEYIVPLSAWTASQPPRLFGQDFHVNAQFQVWALHVWAWDENPNGMYADWNPRVSCAES